MNIDEQRKPRELDEDLDQDVMAKDKQRLIDEFAGDYTDTSPEDEEKARRAEWEDKLQVFGSGIEAEAEEFERLRMPVEIRMLEDMRQTMGVEDITGRSKETDKTRSNLNVNITRKKTNAAEAKLSDMLFPTDEKNWAITVSTRPTVAVEGRPASAPVPPAPAQPQQAAPPQQGSAPMQPGQQPGAAPMSVPGNMQAVPPQGQATQDPGMLEGAQPPLQPSEQPKSESVEIEEAKRDAEARAALMTEVIEDQLEECNYSAAGREAIRSGCMLGTGIMKGPVLLARSRRAWVKKTDEKGISAYVLKDVVENKPGFEFVSVWDFFPEMAATKIEDSEINFQRHWLTRRDLIRLAKRDDFMKDQVRKVLKTSPNRVPPDYLTQLRNMSDISAVGDEKRYVAWERHGPVERDKLVLCGVLEEQDEYDPLEEYQGVIWVCNGIVIKAAINPMDTEDQPWSVFNFEKDDSCIFGYGVPYLMRQPQEVVRKVWRMIMDNAALTVGGQIIINKAIVEPAPTAGGVLSWDVTPLKVWLLKDKTAKAQDAFHLFEFQNHQNELAAIFNMARQLADEETGIPVIAEGEAGVNGPGGTQTAHGMEMLMNNHNIVMRRAVKNWDDNQTIPNITRCYDWNMQNNPNDDIKGDFTPVAKGSTALLQKETQARNILNLVNFLMTPGFAGWAKVENIAKKLVTSMQHDSDEFIKTPEEYAADAAAAQQQAAGQQKGDNSTEIQRMRNDLAWKVHQGNMADKAADREFKALLADRQVETEMMKMSQSEKLTLAEITAGLEKIREKSRADRTLMADETKVKATFGSGI